MLIIYLSTLIAAYSKYFYNNKLSMDASLKSETFCMKSCMLKVAFDTIRNHSITTCWTLIIKAKNVHIWIDFNTF